MLVVDYNISIVLNDGMFSVQNPVTAPDRGTEAFNKVIEASGLVVVGDDSLDAFLSEALLEYADCQRDKSSGQQCQDNNVALHRSAIKVFLTTLSDVSLRDLADVGKAGGLMDDLFAAKWYVILLISCKSQRAFVAIYRRT